MARDVNRRDFLQTLGVTVGAAALGAAGGSTGPNSAAAQAQAPAKGSIPDKPIKIGHMTFFTLQHRLYAAYHQDHGRQAGLTGVVGVGWGLRGIL